MFLPILRLMLLLCLSHLLSLVGFLSQYLSCFFSSLNTFRVAEVQSCLPALKASVPAGSLVTTMDGREALYGTFSGSLLKEWPHANDSVCESTSSWFRLS